MNYIPLRVHSVFSQGAGAVAPAELAERMRRAGLPFLAVADPLSLLAWDRFQVEALRQGLRPLLGVEIRLEEKGTLLLFPRSLAGYYSLIRSFNGRSLRPLAEVAALFLPSVRNQRLLAKLRRKVGSEDFFLGLEWGSPAWIARWAEETKIPLVWANPLRWLNDPRRWRVAAAVFGHLPLQESLAAAVRLDGWINGRAIDRRWGAAGRQALANTFRFAERIAFSFGQLENPAPDPAADDRLAERVHRALAAGNHGVAGSQRAQHELQVIRRLGFAAHFCIAAAIGDFCCRRSIFFNLRGSGVSSFVLYLLGVSRVNPLGVRGLLFERFVNSLRADLPDIDIDIDSSRRQEVFEWVFSEYGERVACVSSHKFFGARSALYETARAAGFNPEEAQALTKKLPLFASPRDLAPEGKGRLAGLYAAAALLEGVFKELSLHVGGVVFSAGPSADVFPLARSPQGLRQIVWDKDAVERLKIFKLDLLGVRGFDVIAPLALAGGLGRRQDDGDVWELIGGGRTLGCFQIESPLARQTLQRARPASLEELAAALAIIRPGPAKAGMKARYLERRPPPHPLLAELFAETRGTLIFEEQVTVLLHRLAGWDLEKAEKARKELKKGCEREAWRREFFALSAARGWRAGELELLWKLILDFSLYAFCQAHSLAYAYAAYLAAWFKARRPLEFFCRLLNAGGGYYPLPVYVDEAQRWGLRVLAPDVNTSAAGFRTEAGALRTGLLLVKGIGEKVAGRILERRAAGYGSLEELVLRAGLSERELSALLAVSALASLGCDGFGRSEKEKNWRLYLGFLPDA